jgi:hypothetical protein
MKLTRSIIGGIALGVITILCSTSLNLTVFDGLYDHVPIARSYDSWEVIRGMGIATVCWGILLSFGFAVLYKGIPGTGLKKGFYYGLILWVLFTPFAEMWIYLQYDIPFMAVISGMIVNFISLLLGGIALAAIYGKSLETVN